MELQIEADSASVNERDGVTKEDRDKAGISV
jgi:hypothetical protein